MHFNCLDDTDSANIKLKIKLYWAKLNVTYTNAFFIKKKYYLVSTYTLLF